MAEVYSGAVDRGLEGVVACTTSVSSIVDATLTYCGYTIEDLAENSNFEEVAFLLWHKRLPNADELEQLRKDISNDLELNPNILAVLKSMPSKEVHPMAWLRTAVSLLAHYDSTAQDNDRTANLRKGVRLMAQMPLLITAFDNFRNGKDYIAPKKDKSIAWNFLYTLTGNEPDAATEKDFDTCLVLHADHELNCSAFAGRVVASSLSDLYSAIVGAIGALKGPLHGGANEQVMKMLVEIGSVDEARKWVGNALANKEKIMGFGHRVYKQGDPRAKVLRKMSQRLTEKTGQSQWYEMSAVIDDTVQSEKGLLPNVDFYSATVYYSLGIPIDLYTPIFAASRVTGWVAHCLEQYENNRIYRPRGEWTGPATQKWVPVSKR